MPYIGTKAKTFNTFTSADVKVTDDLTVTDDASVGGDLTLTGALKNGSTNFTVDSSGDITLDADGGDFIFQDGGSGDEANKVIRFSTPSHDTDEENAQILQVECEASSNQITIGGGTSALNAATKLVFRTSSVDTTTGSDRLNIDGSGNVVFNEDSADADFRIESDNVSHALFVKGSDGNVGLGCSAESMVDKELVVNGPIGNETEIKIRTEGGVNCSIFTAEPTSTHDFGIKTNGVERFRIANNGDLTATDTSISSNSDERLKKDITDYTYDLATFKKYSAKKFNWKQPQYHGDRTNQIGFIAQDLKDIDSQWVSTSKVCSANLEEVLYIEADSDIPEGKKVGDVRTEKLSEHPEAQYLDEDLSVFTSKLGQIDAMYVSIIQQLITKIETLETKVKALEDA